MKRKILMGLVVGGGAALDTPGTSSTQAAGMVVGAGARRRTSRHAAGAASYR